MPAQIRFSQIIDRPVTKVFHFVAEQHVRNHPRWDPDIELWLETDDPIEVGTIIHRRNSRSGTPIEGTMEVVEFDPNHAFGTVIHDGPAEMRGRITFEAISENQTTVTTVIDIPGMDESMDKSFITSRLERSGQNMKQLIESET
ncbi:MAG: SRPBCC family protein [Candidatus Thorarchaeota archaeon]